MMLPGFVMTRKVNNLIAIILAKTKKDTQKTHNTYFSLMTVLKVTRKVLCGVRTRHVRKFCTDFTVSRINHTERSGTGASP